MAYYPKSQVKPNLYTNGGEFTTIQNQTPNQSGDYTGYYFTTSTGKIFTGKSPTDTPNNPLYPVQSIEIPEPSDVPRKSNLITYDYNERNIIYASKNNINTSQTRIIPQFNVTLPITQDKQRGFLIRYFCKKNNELIYFETSQEDYDRIKSQDPSMAYDLYSTAALRWYIVGDPPQVANQNISQVNQTSAANGWLGFIQYFQGDFTKYLGT